MIVPAIVNGCCGAHIITEWQIIAPALKGTTAMTTRMIGRTVMFQRPFILSDFSHAQPPGSYTVETEEEQIDPNSSPAWKRTMTIMHLKDGVTTEYRRIDPDELEEALLRDKAEEYPATLTEPGSAAARHTGTRASRLVHRKKF